MVGTRFSHQWVCTTGSHLRFWRHSLGCTDLQQLDRQTRKLLSTHPCSDGGRGLQQIESTYQSCIVRLNYYLADCSDPFMQMIRESDSGRSSHSIKRMFCRFTAQLWRSLALDDKSQNLHRNASISVEGGFEQALETDARHYRTVAVLFVFGPGA